MERKLLLTLLPFLPAKAAVGAEAYCRTAYDMSGGCARIKRGQDLRVNDRMRPAQC